jgi:hypothetical protein
MQYLGDTYWYTKPVFAFYPADLSWSLFPTAAGRGGGSELFIVKEGVSKPLM